MSRSHRDTAAVEPGELAAWQREGRAFTVLDVRGRDEFETWHVEAPDGEAVQMPHQQFIAARAKGTITELVPDGPEPILVVCGKGRSSADVAK
ncbi:MAG: rhodanese-like domain-containing protein, partial [Halolamina sp.]